MILRYKRVIFTIIMVFTTLSIKTEEVDFKNLDKTRAVAIVNSNKTRILKQSNKNMKTNTYKTLNIIVTHYTNSVHDCGNTKGISASGKNLVRASRYSRGAKIHYIATPKDIPFGTKIWIDKIGICEVVDRGGAIKYKWINGKKYIKIDLFVPNATHKQLMKMGKYYTQGYIIK